METFLGGDSEAALFGADGSCLLWQGAIPLTVEAIWIKLHAAPIVIDA